MNTIKISRRRSTPLCKEGDQEVNAEKIKSTFLFLKQNA
jgi:hypothetical protein